MLTESLILALITVIALDQGVDPEFARNVAKVESSCPKTGAQVRIGRLGKSKFYGPMGIHKDFKKKWDIENPVCNIVIGVKALRGRNKRKILKRYNPKADAAYFMAVLGKGRIK